MYGRDEKTTSVDFATATCANNVANAGTQLECKGERPVIETMAITANRLDEIERKLVTIHNYLFGPEPADCCERANEVDTNVKSLAGSAFSSSVRLERHLDEIYKRLAN